MLKLLAWNTFKNTGSIDTFLEIAEMKKIEDNMLLGENYGDSKNEGNNNCRK